MSDIFFELYTIENWNFCVRRGSFANWPLTVFTLTLLINKEFDFFLIWWRKVRHLFSFKFSIISYKKLKKSTGEMSIGPQQIALTITSIWLVLKYLYCLKKHLKNIIRLEKDINHISIISNLLNTRLWHRMSDLF